MTIAGIHPQPYGTWMEQMACNLTDPVDGCLRRARYLIHDRDPLYTRGFGEILEGGVSSRSVSRRRVPISTRMPSGSSALLKRSVSVAVLLLLFGLLRSGQVKLRALVGYQDMEGMKQAA